MIAAGMAVLLLPAALASAEEPKAPDEAEIQAVARGLFELQQQMGGSIVTESDLLQAAPAKQPPKGRRPGAKPKAKSPGNPIVGKVRLLRDTAWKLDGLANRFEYAGLYRQADGLRRQAQAMRIDARKLVAGAKAAPPKGKAKKGRSKKQNAKRPSASPGD